MQGAQVFIKLDEYNQIMEVIGLLRKKIEIVKKTLTELDSIRTEENAEVENWQSEIDQLESRLNTISSSLVSPDMR